MDKPGNVLSCNAASQLFGSYLCTHSHTPAHTKGSVASLHNTCVGTALASCIPGVAVLTVLVLLAIADMLFYYRLFGCLIVIDINKNKQEKF